jgi:hypothetical protein
MINSNQIDHLKRIHAAYNPDGFSFQNPKQPMTAQLINTGHLLVDHGTVDPSNSAKVAMQLSESGMEHIEADSDSVSSTVAATVPQPSFPAAGVPTGVPQAATVKRATGPRGPRGPRVVPVIRESEGFRFAELPTAEKRAREKGSRPETYKFSTLAAPDDSGYDSFFVEATDAMPNPGKTLTGTVISANKRFVDQGIVFKLVPVESDLQFGVKGARILRVK